MATFEIFRSEEDYRYYFLLKARNGQITLVGQRYASRHACLESIRLARTNAVIAARYERHHADGYYWFNLLTTSGTVIGRSQTYKTASGCSYGIKSVKRDAPAAEVPEEERVVGLMGE